MSQFLPYLIITLGMSRSSSWILEEEDESVYLGNYIIAS